MAHLLYSSILSTLSLYARWWGVDFPKGIGTMLGFELQVPIRVLGIFASPRLVSTRCPNTCTHRRCGVTQRTSVSVPMRSFPYPRADNPNARIPLAFPALNHTKDSRCHVPNKDILITLAVETVEKVGKLTTNATRRGFIRQRTPWQNTNPAMKINW